MIGSISQPCLLHVDCVGAIVGVGVGADVGGGVGGDVGRAVGVVVGAVVGAPVGAARHSTDVLPSHLAVSPAPHLL